MAGEHTSQEAGRQTPDAQSAEALPAYLVLLVLLQQPAAMTEELLQAQLRLPALPHALGEVCHQAAGTGEQSLGPPSARGCPPPRPLLSQEPGQDGSPHWASVSPSAIQAHPPRAYEETCTKQGA